MPKAKLVPMYASRSTETKPPNAPYGSLLTETDTGKVFYKETSGWFAMDERITSMGSISVPPSGQFLVTNLYVDTEGKLQVEYNNTPVP